MRQEHTENKWLSLYLFPALIFGVFLIGYWPAFQKLMIRWGGGDNSYCYLIVPLFAYLLWEKRGAQAKGKGHRAESSGRGLKSKDQGVSAKQGEGVRITDYGLRGKGEGLATPQTSSKAILKPQAAECFFFGDFSWSIWGLIPVLLSIFLIIIGEMGSVETLLYTGLWGCAVGMTFILYGWRARYLVFPMVILLFIVPLPAFINRILTFQLKLAASTFSVAMLRISGVSVLQEGNIIDLGITQLQVVDACSGLRYLMPLLLTGLLVGYFFNKKLWERAVLILVVAPLSIFVNAVRIWITGMLTIKGYEKLAQSFFHDFSGWLIYMIAGGILVAIALTLKGLRIKDQGSRIRNKKQEVRDQKSEVRMPQTSSETILKPAAIEGEMPQATDDWIKPMIITIVLCLLFSSSGWALKVIPSAKNLPNRMSFESFPMQIGPWQGKRHFISKEILTELWSDDYISATYLNPNSKNHINLLIPFYEYQGTRHTAHAPQACMLGSGWALFKSSERFIDLNPNEKTKIMTMIWEKEDYKILGSYFFFQRGRVITNPWKNKFYLMLDAFIKRRTDGALVRVEMPIAPGQSVESAYKTLEGLIAKIWPILPDYIPL